MSYEEKREKIAKEIDVIIFQKRKIEGELEYKKQNGENCSSLFDELKKLETRKMELVNLYNIV